MENTALNNTTANTKDHEDWKKKKGYGPILVAAATLALLLSLYAGGHLGSSTNLRHGEMGTTNAAASSLSTSLVSSVTTAAAAGYGATESSGQPPGTNCKNTSDCAIPSGLDHPVCRNNRCQSGAPGSSCGATSDCVVPPGLDHAVCRDGYCQSGASGSSCGVTSDCVVPQGLDHGVCLKGVCQSGFSGSSCGVTSDCLSRFGCWGGYCWFPAN